MPSSDVFASRIEMLKHEIATLRRTRTTNQLREETHQWESCSTEFVIVDSVAPALSGPDENRNGDFAYGGWQAPHVNADGGEDLMFAQASTMHALLLGRRTYEICAGRRQVERRPDQGE